MQGNKTRFAFPIQLFNEKEKSVFAEAPSEIHVVPTGKWNHPAYGEMEIKEEHIEQFVENYSAGLRLDLPITAGHDNGMSGGEMPAIGWFKELINKGKEGLYAIVEWTEEGKKMLREGAFKYFSPEFYTEYEDPETRKTYRHVLVGGALTNKPYFKELTPVVAFSEPNIINQFSNNETTMDLKTIVAKKVEELSAEEKAYLLEHKSELTPEQTEAFKSVVGEPAETDEQKTAREEKEKGDANEAAGLNRDGSAKTPAPEVNASEKGKMIQMSEVEVTLLKKKADEGAQAFAEVERMRIEKGVSALIFSETNKDGKFLPKQKDSVEKFFSSLNVDQRKSFGEILASMPKLSFGEIGDGGSTEKSVAKEVEGKIAEKMKANEKMKYSEALVAVMKENPALEKSYNESLGSEE